MEASHIDLMQELSIFVKDTDLSIGVANQKLFRVGSPTDERNSEWKLFAPASISLDTSNNDMSIFIGDTDLGAIWTPFHVSDDWGFSIIDHFLNPLVVVLHENYNLACGVAGS